MRQKDTQQRLKRTAKKTLFACAFFWLVSSFWFLSHQFLHATVLLITFSIVFTDTLMESR